MMYSLVEIENKATSLNQRKGILDELEALGIQEGDTVRMYGLAFDYYK